MITSFNADQLTGTQKAALVLMQIGKERASRVMSRLDEPVVEALTAEIVRLERVDRGIADQVIEQFHQVTLGGVSLVSNGGMNVAHQLLEASFGSEKADELMERLSASMAGQTFEFLQQADARQVLALLHGEHPQTMALVMAHLRPEHASAIMAGLPPATQAEVAHRIAMMERAAPDVVQIVADALNRKASAVLTPRETAAIGGVGPLVEIINRADPGTEKLILEGLESRDAALAEEVRSQMFVFADIVLLEDKALQLVLRGIETNNLALALKGAGVAERDAVLRNLSERARENLTEEIDLLGAVRMSQVEEARSAIVQMIRKLEESGQITVRREGEDEYVS